MANIRRMLPLFDVLCAALTYLLYVLQIRRQNSRRLEARSAKECTPGLPTHIRVEVPQIRIVLRGTQLTVELQNIVRVWICLSFATAVRKASFCERPECRSAGSSI